MNAYEQHMKELAVPMRKELTDQGFLELTTEDNVNDFMKNVDDDATTFVMVNSICGCAAGIARPAAVTVASQNPIKPDHLVTVFAGQDKKQQNRCVNSSCKRHRAHLLHYLKDKISYILYRDQI